MGAGAGGSHKAVIGGVLVVEDNLVNQRVAVALLKKLGLAADIADSGAEALEELAKNDYRAVLMDMQMPVMDGLAATRAIRERELASGGRRTPIVAMTANAGQVDQDRCSEAGMDEFVSKPIDLPALFEVLAKVHPDPNQAGRAA